MSKIDDLISQPVEVNFRGEKFMLASGFTLEETPAIQMAFLKNNSASVKAEGMRLILKIIARRLFPDAPEKKISKIDSSYTGDLLKVFFQLDGSDEKEIKNAKEIIGENK